MNFNTLSVVPSIINENIKVVLSLKKTYNHSEYLSPDDNNSMSFILLCEVKTDDRASIHSSLIFVG
jgi:hypothetical protein